MQFRLARIGITRKYRAVASLPDGVLGELRFIQDFKINRVVEIVTVIFYLIDKVCDLVF